MENKKTLSIAKGTTSLTFVYWRWHTHAETCYHFNLHMLKKPSLMQRRRMRIYGILRLKFFGYVKFQDRIFREYFSSTERNEETGENE